MFERAPQIAERDGVGAAIAAAMKNRVHEIWPENWPVFNLFGRLGTQWSESMNGRAGLRYEAAYPLMDRMGLSNDDWNLMFADIQAMERAALDAMREDD